MTDQTQDTPDDPFCCCIDCDQNAEFVIAGNHFEDVVHACKDHVGALLGTPDWLSEDNTMWTVSVIQTESL